MINKNFYPTPNNLIDKMLECVDLPLADNILEPSAGKGDIADAICEKLKIRTYDYNTKNHQQKIDCIELDEELIATLKGKGYRVIYNDFLTFNTNKQYDLIVMNPPFDNGCKHLLKALELQQNGGNIICILNAETLKNPYSNERKVLVQKLEEYNADIEYLQNSFLQAERKTDVEIALIKIAIPKKTYESEIYTKLKQEQKQIEYEYQSTELTKFAKENEYIERAVEQFNLESNLGIKLIQEYYSMQPYLFKRITEEKWNDNILKLTINGRNANTNDFLKEIRYKYWEALFANPKFTQNLTSNLKSELNSNLEKLRDYDFTMYNIMTIQEELIKKTIKGVEDTILNLFDEFSLKYAYYGETGKNIHYYNGWCTNNAFKINNKVIIPLSAYSNIWGRLEYDYKVAYKLIDVIKTFDYLSGTLTDAEEIRTILKQAQDEQITKDIDLKYFYITFYKKGTCHITFKDLELLKKFNIFGSSKKGWLPPNFGKKSYKKMNTEEQKVVDSFCGQEEYIDILNNKNYYLQKEIKLING